MDDEKKKTTNSLRKKVMLYMFMVIIVAIVIQVIIIAWTNRNNANRTATVLLNQVIDILAENELSEEEVIDNIPAYEGINIYVADAEDGSILGTTNINAEGKNLKDINLYIDNSIADNTVTQTATIDEYMNYCEYRRSGDNIVVVTYSTKNNIEGLIVAIGIELIYLFLACLVIYLIFNRLIAANKEKNEQLSILASMSGIYYSMHLIDLEKNSIKEYSANEKIKGIIDLETNADEMVNRLMSAFSAKEHRKAVLEFTDIHSVQDRMQNKKMISIEFEGEDSVWFTVSFITIEADCNGRPKKVMFVTRNIDDIKKKEELLIAKSYTDELTGLFNRRAYEDDLSAYNDSGMQENFVYVAFDVNGLKHVNDTLGHAAGDELIVGASMCIKQCLGSYGKLYRIGGDEFVAIIFADEKQLENIKKDLDDTMAKWSGEFIDSLNISCGYVTKKEAQTLSVREISILADKRMYEDKAAYYQQNGNDRRH